MTTRPQLAALVQTYHLAAEMFEIQAVASEVDLSPTIRFLRRMEANYRADLAVADARTAEFNAMTLTGGESHA